MKIAEVFLPSGAEVISLDVRCDILYLDDDLATSFDSELDEETARA